MVDPYAAESPAEFFAVMSEAFFQTPYACKAAFSGDIRTIGFVLSPGSGRAVDQPVTHYFISGDIGGTKTLLQAGESKYGQLQVYCEHRYASREYNRFSDMLKDFLERVAAEDTPVKASRPVVACFAVAGPIEQGKVNLTNLPWVIDSAAIAAEFSILRSQAHQ